MSRDCAVIMSGRQISPDDPCNTRDFYRGWLPGWLSEKNNFLEGSPPGASDKVRLRLISACVNRRWQPLSGGVWNRKEAEKKEQNRMKRMVPAGSVYFFERVDDTWMILLKMPGCVRCVMMNRTE
jgi:hypothetical protein